MPIEKLHKARWILAGILFISVLVYFPVLNNDFTNWDDPAQVLENPDVHAVSFAGTAALFSNFYVGMYQPLTMHAYTFLYTTFGDDPFAFHLFSLLVHLLNIMLVYVLVLRFTRKEAPALVVAAMFALNPLQSESVAWVSALSNLLYASFFLGGLIFYLAYLREKKNKYLVYTFLLFMLSLLSKPSAITFPVVLFFADLYFRRAFGVRMMLEKLLFFIPAAILGMVIFLARDDAGHIISISERFGWWERPLLIIYALTFYIAKLFAPLGLSAFHPYPDSPLPAEFFIAPLIPIMFIFLYTRLRGEARRQYMVGMMFFLLNILLLLEFIPLGVQVVKERYVYLPSIGIYYAFASLLFFFFPIKKFLAKWPTILVSAFIIWFGLTTFSRVHSWRDSLTLWNNVLEEYPEASAALINRGNAYLALEVYQQAVDDYSRAIDHEPNAADAYLNRAIVYYKLDEKSAALMDYDRAILLGMLDAEVYNNRGLLKAALNDIGGAINDFEQASQIDPAYSDAWINLGLMHANNEAFNKAFEALSNAVRADARSARAYYWRGMILLRMNQLEDACRDLKTAREYGWPTKQIPEICN